MSKNKSIYLYSFASLLVFWALPVWGFVLLMKKIFPEYRTQKALFKYAALLTLTFFIFLIPFMLIGPIATAIQLPINYLLALLLYNSLKVKNLVGPISKNRAVFLIWFPSSLLGTIIGIITAIVAFNL